MTIPTKKQLSSLPKWAQSYIEKLEAKVTISVAKLERAQEMMRWTKPGMDWFTLFAPPHRSDSEITVFTCDEGGTVKLCTLGRRDYLFVGRSMERDL